MVSLPHLLRSNQTLAHVLQDGVHLAATETDAIHLAQGMAAAGLVQLSTFDYVLCVNPEDDDYLDLLGNNCDGRVQVSTEPLLCPSCGRQLEYPELYKQVYHETVITLNPPAIADYVFELFADTSGVSTVKRLDLMTSRLLMTDDSEIEVVVSLAPDSATRHARKERSAVLTVCSSQRAPTRHPDNRIDLVELLTEDGAWRAQLLRRLTVSSAGALPPRRGRGDQLDIRVGVLQDGAYPVEFTINGTRHFQGRAVAAFPDLAMRTGVDALFLWLCNSPTLLAAWKTACEGDTPCESGCAWMPRNYTRYRGKQCSHRLMTT
ncbi:MAG: hypothetical protein IPK16_17310 [Anaerolineales bacterium]|nr:hypothetical protein [Anaerolineales bacterium]